eukprot:jgi/Bigna1/60246/fgenesh1_kg.10_\
MQQPSAPEMEQPASTQAFQPQPMPVEVQPVPVGQPIPALHQPQIAQHVHQPVIVAVPTTVGQQQAQQLRHWESSLCSCCDQCAPSCLMAWCCPCFTIARIRAIEGIKEPKCVQDLSTSFNKYTFWYGVLLKDILC